MRIPELKEKIKTCMESQIPVLILGAPGTGKSQAIRQVAEEQKRGMVDLRLPLLNPVDLRGIPVAQDGQAHWWAPSFLPRGEKNTDILLLDEITSAPPAVQVAGYQLVLDRKVGEYTLPEGCSILAAGNRQNDKAIVYEMSSALRNRFLHIEVDVNLDDWKDWAGTAGISHVIISFLNFKPEYLFYFDHKKHKQNFPTPRSWEFVNRIIANKPITSAIQNAELIQGLLGEGVATEFIAYCRIIGKLPNPEDVILGGNMGVSCGSEPSVRYAFCGALTGCAERAKDSVKAFKNLVTYCTNGLPVEFAVLALKDFARTDVFKKNYQKFAYLPEWTAFCAKFGVLVHA